MKSDLKPIQDLIVKACLASSEAERRRWVRGWEENVVIDDLDYSSSRLIPYFFHKNQEAGITTRHDKRLKVIHKHWWLKTQHITDQLNKVLALFTAAGIEYVVIKGAATRAHYEFHELRPMADFDVLVQPKDLSKALDLLREADYIPHKDTEAGLKRSRQLMLDFMHGISCTHRFLNAQVDLHWRIGSLCSMDFTEKLWANLEAYDLFPGARKPRLPYEVFIILLHASVNRSHDNLNWIIDIAVLNHTTGGSFWEDVHQLFIEEKKEDIFDYACAILLEYGVNAPSPLKRVKPPVLVLINDKIKQEISLLKLIRIKLSNIHFQVSRLYPHAHLGTRIYQYIRRIRFRIIMKRI